MRTSKSVGAVVFLVAAAVGGVVAYQQSSGAPKSGTATTLSSASSSSSVGARASRATPGTGSAGSIRARTFKPAMQRVYAVTSTQSTQLLGGGGKNASASAVSTRLEGELGLSYVENSGSLVRLRGTLGTPKLTVTDGTGKPLDAGRVGIVEHDLAAPFFITLDENGEVHDLHVHKGMVSLARGLVRSLASTMQVVDREGATWKEREQDTTGEYEATYVRGGNAIANLASLSLSKTKNKYTRLAGPNGLVPLTHDTEARVSATSELVLDGAGWLQTLHAKEDLSIQPGSRMPSAHATSETTLTVVGTQDDPTALGSFQRDLDALEDAAAATAAENLAAQKQSDELLVAGATLTTLTKALAAVRQGDSASKATLEARMSALLRLDPTAAGAAATRIRNGAPHEQADSLIAAMGGSGTPEAQRALTQVLEDTNVSTDARTASAMALAGTQAPTAETAEALQRASNDHDPDVSHTSSLALGGVAREMRESDPTTASSSVDALLTKLDGAASTEDNVVLLRALGNAGDPRVLPYAERAMANSDPVVRMAAVAAVRYLTRGGADTLVGEAMTHDGDEDVRQEAVSTATYRPLDAQLAPLAEVLRHDVMEKVRLEAIRTLAPVHRGNAEVESLLHEIAKSDPSTDVRALATAALAI